MNISLDQADVLIDLTQQLLYLPKLKKHYSISSGKNGIGEQENSGKTPRGWHRVAQKIGQDHPKYSVFVARKWTGEIYDDVLSQQYPTRDWILSRILWLEGLEEGFNRGAGCDTFNRYIYIHGTPETEPMHIPMSHGCIRLHNQDVIELFEQLDQGALIYISEQMLDLKL